MYGSMLAPKDAAAHNMYLQILAETGLLGFAAFLLLLRAVGQAHARAPQVLGANAVRSMPIRLRASCWESCCFW